MSALVRLTASLSWAALWASSVTIWTNVDSSKVYIDIRGMISVMFFQNPTPLNFFSVIVLLAQSYVLRDILACFSLFFLISQQFYSFQRFCFSIVYLWKSLSLLLTNLFKSTAWCFLLNVFKLVRVWGQFLSSLTRWSELNYVSPTHGCMLS